MKIKLIKRLYRIALNIFSPLLISDYFKFRRSGKNKDKGVVFEFLPQVFDKTKFTSFDRHYVYHTSWAARKVKEINPLFHVDISSSLYFSGIVSAFVPVRFYDYRPANLNLSNLEPKEGNLLSLPFENGTVHSLSCMHTIEHIGLGRYGDEIDYEGDMKAINELKRVLAPGGDLLFVTPVGKPKIMFNAHRIYSYQQVSKYFEGFELVEFSLVHEYEEDGGISVHADPIIVEKEEYACGLFWFRKPLNLSI